VTTTTASLVAPLAWDSAFFGFPVARVVPPRLRADTMAAVLGASRAAGTRLLYYLCDGTDRPSVHLAEEHGFHLMDVRVAYERTFGAGAAPGVDRDGGMRLRPAVPGDRTGLRELTRGAYTASRFYFDERIPVERADALYASWLDGLLDRGAEVLVAEPADPGPEPSGYVATEREGAGARIVLLAVAPDARRRGVGTALVNESLRRACLQGCGRVEVVTHGREVAAQRLYQRCGFLLAGTGLWYHRWLD
jgi:dTDP-4-amino-4,6-dideoxy-D-galactose acyltransferase